MKRTLRPSRLSVWSGALFFVLGAGFALAAEEPSTGPIIELPKFVVTDTRELPPPEPWRFATIAGFEVLTNASDRATQRLLRDFDMFRQALSIVWPIQSRVTSSTALIICGRRGKFDGFVPNMRIGPETALASLLLKKSDFTAIVIDMQATTLNVLDFDGLDALPGTDSGLLSVDHDKQLYREYVRYLLSQTEPRVPAWLEEGLAQVIMKMQVYPRWIEFARLEDPNTVSTQAAMTAELNAMSAGEDGDGMTLPGAPAEDRDFNAALRRRALVPLDKFFAVKHDSPEAVSTLGNNRWAKQAYAFVHMCLYGVRGKYQKPFATFIQRAARAPVTEDIFKECFKMSYKQMLMELRSYIEFTDYQHQQYTARKGGPDLIVAPPPLQLRDATESEVGRIKGEAMLAAGHAAAARRELIAPYVRGERDPQLLASLGLYERSNGEKERARKFLESAVAAKVTRPNAYVELARMRFEDAMAKPAGPNRTLSREQSAAVIGLLKVGRRQPPHLPELYDLMTETWTRSAATPTHEDVAMLVDGVHIFPGRLKLAYQTAALAADAGLTEAAHSLADHGLRYAPNPESKTRFEKLKAALPPAPPPSAPATSAPPQPAAPAATKKGR